MQKDVNYHAAAVQYNDELAQFAGDLAERLKHPEVQKWSRSVSKQHKFHLGRHKKALKKLQEMEEGATVDTEDGGEDTVIDDQRTVHRSAESGQFVTEEKAEENPSTTVAETIEVERPDVPRAAGDVHAPFAVESVPDPAQAAAPVDAGVGPDPGLSEEEAREMFERAHAEAVEAAKKGANE